jgi:hypothetical protein
VAEVVCRGLVNFINMCVPAGIVIEAVVPALVVSAAMLEERLSAARKLICAAAMPGGISKHELNHNTRVRFL